MVDEKTRHAAAGWLVAIVCWLRLSTRTTEEYTKQAGKIMLRTTEPLLLVVLAPAVSRDTIPQAHPCCITFCQTLLTYAARYPLLFQACQSFA